MKITCYAHYDKFYVLNNNLSPEAIELIRDLGGHVDEDGDYFWDRDTSSLYYVIYQLSRTYYLEIK